MRRIATKRSNALYGLVALAIVAVAVFFGFTKTNPFANPYEIKAAFKNVNDLKPRSPVRIAGVNVGKVKSVEPMEGGTGAIVTMEIKDEGLPIHTDAQAKVRPRIFLEGNYFVDLRPGSPSAPAMDEGATIPVQNTAAPVQFGQFLEMLQSDTRENLRTVLREYGKAVNGPGGRGFNRALKYWEPAFKNTAQVNEATLGIEEHDLSNYLRGARKVAEGLDRDPRALKGLITNLSITATAFADEQDNLSATIRELPNTLRAGQRAFAALRTAFPPVRRLARAMLPTVRTSGPALDAQLPLVRQLRGLVSKDELQGLVKDLRPAVSALAELNREGVPLQEETRLAGSCNNNVLHEWNETEVPDPNFPAHGPIYQEASKQFVGLAAESRSFDANGQYVRSYAQNANYASAVGDGRFFFTDLPVLGVNPPKAPRQPPYRPDVPCETQEVPDMRTRIQAPPRQIKINQNAPGAAERRARVQKALMEWMGQQLDATEMGDKYKLSKEPLTAAEIPQVVAGR
ncbi:MAG: MlaD family protein [Actinomycetota bacterium]|nr:MlaD family protein [Actinomycetota bacterium]